MSPARVRDHARDRARTCSLSADVRARVHLPPPRALAQVRLTVDPARYEAGADAGSKPWLIANAIRDPVAEAAEAARAEEARRAALAARTPHDRFHLHKPAGADNVAKPITSLGASMNTPGQRRFETVEEVLARGAVAAVAAVGAPCCGSLVSHSSSPLILIVVTGR